MLHNLMRMKQPSPKNRHSIPFLMRLITDRARTLFAEKADCPFTAAQARVAMYLKKKGGGPVTQHELEKYLGVSHSTIKGLVQRLEDKGYVYTAFDSRDGRVKNVYLTNASQKYKERMHEQLQELDARLLSGLSEEEVSELTRMLEHIYDNIS